MTDHDGPAARQAPPAPFLTVHAGRPTEQELAALTVALLTCLRRSGAPEGARSERWANWPGSDAHQTPDWSAPHPDTTRFSPWTSAEGV